MKFVIVQSKSTKAEILRVLKTTGRLSITEMAKKLSITDMAVRRHIHSLERDDFVQSIMNRQTKGRPSKIYELSQKGEELFPKRYKQLSMELLHELKLAGQESLIAELFLRRKKRLLEKHESETSGKSFSEKLYALKELQASEGFMPEMTNVNGVIHFKEFNCPYVEAAKEFKQICTSERELMKELLQTDSVKVASCMAEGESCCHYIINPK